MKIKINIICVSLLMMLMLVITTAEAGGRSNPEIEKSESGVLSILPVSWLKDGVIHVALANTSRKAQQVKVDMGSGDIQYSLIGSKSLTVMPNTIRIIHFPLAKEQKTKDKVNKTYFISIYTPDGRLLNNQTVQNETTSSSQLSTKNFVTASGDLININYDIRPMKGLRLVFVPRTLPAQDKIMMPIGMRKGFLKTCSEKDLDKLGLPDEYSRQMKSGLEDNVGFIIKAGEKARINANYTVPVIRDCAIVRLSDYQYLFDSGSGVSYGAGPARTVMIYNPSVMKIYDQKVSPIKRCLSRE